MDEERERVRSDSSVVSIADKTSEVRPRLGMDVLYDEMQIGKSGDARKEWRSKGREKYETARRGHEPRRLHRRFMLNVMDRTGLTDSRR